jgi:intron-binding protein aquarius
VSHQGIIELFANAFLLDTFTENSEEFSVLFRRILSLSIDTTLPATSKLYLLAFIISAFQSLEKGLIRKECAPLVSIAIWQNLHSETAREALLDKHNTLRRAWRAAQKRYDAGDEITQAKIRFDRSWLYTMIVDFSRRLNDPKAAAENAAIAYCERFLELLVDLTSQLPTRRYTNTLLKDFNLLPIIKLSRMFDNEKNVLLRDLHGLLQHFVNFAIDDHAGQQFSQQANYEAHCEALAGLQRVAMKHFETKLKVMALSNYASIDQRAELESVFSSLSDEELLHLCELLDLRTTYPKQAGLVVDRQFLVETLISTFERHRDFQDTTARLSVLPTEASLYDPALLRNETYDGSSPLAIPKLNLQYLSLGDFLWRSFLLQRSEAFYEIRKDMESTIKRMRPRTGRDRDVTLFDGFSRMSIPIAKPAIIEVGQPKVGTNKPAHVRAEILLDVSRLNDSIRSEWDSLRPGDVIFLLAVKAGRLQLANGHSNNQPRQDWEIAHLRAAEVVQILDENSRPLRDSQAAQVNGFTPRARQRRLLVNIDSSAFKSDIDRTAKGKPDIYHAINVIVRRKGRENNFKPILQTMQHLIASETQLPSWFQEVFLGYGDPTSATYTQLQEKILTLDFRDTFLDWEHLQASFPRKTIVSEDPESLPFEPPYVLEPFVTKPESQPANPKKRRRDQMESNQSPPSTMRVSTYKPPNAGPYPVDVPKTNKIRFTPAQVEAIMSGTQPGLSVIVGPPGTGKTDVATQIINLLYHNFPQERILLVAHSNQALNQLFQKIIALDIDGRHLLRLGHGEEELESQASYSKFGRVESFLENRQGLLGEVERLAASIGAQGAHGSSCETAEYFNKVHIQPAWAHYWDVVRMPSATRESVIESFPFHGYFSAAPQPLFPPDAPLEVQMDIATGCERHISKVFSELESIRPFEILRHSRDQANHLLVNEARIIAMTTTHAAMRQSEIAGLGFHYDTLIMEEAAQVTEIESFIPCAMQEPDPNTGELSFKRMVLIGDHFQNSPIVQNMAIRQYANFEQSLFLRLVRLGVPTINLDQQGRCRPSIAELFKWRYPALGNLPSLAQEPDFARANAGFRYDYQFIDVPDYQEQGEREPSPHFIQNLGEAEYAVALFQYMRLLGYPGRSISILATYAGQKALIRDVLDHRCKGNRLFGLPRIVTTVDKYQGEQNDYIVLSLTRTRGVGYLRDVRRLTVALSRARLGLYILGRRDLFETCYEFKAAMDILLQRPDKLVLATGEMFPATRGVEDKIEGTEMDGVEHLGQYVFEMTQAKVKALGGQLTLVEGADGAEEGYVAEMDRDEVDEEDPLHENVVPE